MAQITLPHHLTNGTVADASQVMANFNAIVNVVNGNLGSDNIGSITGAEITTKDLNGGNTLLDNFTQRFQAGVLRFENIPAKSYQSKQLTFHNPFPGVPHVFLTQNVGTPDNLFVSYGNTSKSGTTVVIRNDYGSDRAVINVPWLAVYTGAMS